MKKYRTVIFLIIIAALAVGCFALWRNWNAEQQKLEDLCTAGASGALHCFQAYTQTGSMGDYWNGVGEFRCFMQAYLLLDEAHPEYAWLNTVYGEMTLRPEQVQANPDGLITALELLAADWADPNGYLRIHEYMNLLIHGE